MPVLRIYGASDDLVEFEGIPSADEFSVYKTPKEFAIISSEGSCRIIAHYDGTWSFAVARLSDDTPLPDWDWEIEDHPSISYSTLLLVRVPEGTTIKELVSNKP